MENLSQKSEDKKRLKILHFNDVYNISHDPNNEVCGGISRFAAKLKEIKKKNPDTVILFSGDLWSPSRRKPSNLYPNLRYFDVLR